MPIPLQCAMNQVSADGCHGAAGDSKLSLRNIVKLNAKLRGHKANFYKNKSGKTTEFCHSTVWGVVCCQWKCRVKNCGNGVFTKVCTSFAFPAANDRAYCEYLRVVWPLLWKYKGLKVMMGFPGQGGGNSHSYRQGICLVSHTDLLSPPWLHPAWGAFPVHMVRALFQELIIMGCIFSKHDAQFYREEVLISLMKTF